MLSGNAIAQIEPSGRGIHLFWMGPVSWVYSPGGWNIQRRQFSRKASRCEAIGPVEIDRIRLESEWRLSFGWVSYSTGQFDANTPAEIFRIDLDSPTEFVRLNLRAKIGFSYALYKGKVVSAVSPKNSGSFSVEFMATAIDAVVSWILGPESIQYCIYRPAENEEESWRTVPFIAKGLQLPLKELDTSLQGTNEELDKARSRLLPGEEIDDNEFRELTDTLRITVKTNAYPRHIDKILLMRAEEGAGFEELNATTPLLSLVNHPKWRRAMGFGWFDQDSTLEEGKHYEYRITGFFPLEDLHDRIYGFHTISSNTLLPTSFFLGDLMLRFSQPPTVELAPGTPSDGMQQLSRRGVVLQTADQFFWPFPSIENWSLVLDFPFPVQLVQLELMPGHSLDYEAWHYNNPVASGSLPTGNIISLNFPSSIVQLRLKGVGFLFTIRISTPLKGIQPVSMVLPPVLFVNTPRPASPTFFEATNLQENLALQPDSIPLTSQRSALGFRLRWQPALPTGLAFWPPNAPTAPPIESTLYQIEHRQVPSTNWGPLLPEDNWIIGHRRTNNDKAAIHAGADLMQLFPESPGPEQISDSLMSWEDVFDFSINNEPVIRPVPDLGTAHEYRIRAVDIIGRSGDDWKVSNQAELQKLLPPPVPVGPVPILNSDPGLSTPKGVYARLLVKDAPDLTTEEISLLGSDNNVILLRWGWHKEQRELDSFAREFRVYRNGKALDSIKGQLVAVANLGTGLFEASFLLERAIRENAVKNTFINFGGYPYHVRSNESGTMIKMMLERKIPDTNGQLSPPPTGPVNIPVLIGSDSLRPENWTDRIGIVPISGDTAYSFELRNALDLSTTHTKDEIWLGVSAADDQPYVEDKLFPTANRKGNESPLVPVLVQGKFQGRPLLAVPPPMEDVPRLLTKEPESTGVRLEINVADFLDAGILAGVSHFRLERIDAGTLFNQYSITDNNRIMALAPSSDQPDLEIIVPNPSDKNNIIAALQQVNAFGMADRYLVFLAAAHPYRDSLFEAVTPNPVPLGLITDNFLPQTNRFVYRIRTGNAAGLISAGDAILKMVVRVPSLKPGPVPELIPRKGDTPAGLIRVRIISDNTISHVVFFYADATTTAKGPLPKGSLLRIANRPDLYPDNLLRFRTPAGEFAQQFIVDLNNSNVEVNSNGSRIVSFQPDEEEGSSLQIWACTLTVDGIPSEPAGPWRTLVPVL